jgi:hypothetical protein
MDLSENKFETDDDKPFICSCCSESFNTKLCPPFLLLELASSLEYAQAQKSDITAEAVHDDNNEATTKSDSPSSIHRESGCEMETTCSSLRDTAEDQGLRNSLNDQEQDMRMHHDHQQGEAALLMVNKIAAKTSSGELKSLKIARGFTDDSSVVEVEKRNQDLVGEASDDFVTAPGAQTLLVDTEELTTDKKEPNDPPGTEKL